MRYAIYRSLALVPLLAIAGCGILAPFPSATPPAPPGTTGVPVGICYSRLASSTDDLRALAAQECGSGQMPQLVDTEWNVNNCPLLTPTRAIFICTAR